MERESFEDEEIGKILSENFVCIKVDREERPDVDKVYMTFVQVRIWLYVCLIVCVKMIMYNDNNHADRSLENPFLVFLCSSIHSFLKTSSM